MQNQRVIALGFFDGVHRGHGALLQRARSVAEQTGLTPAVMTFDQHPGTLTGHPVLLINTPSDRADIIRRIYGIEQTIFAHFDSQMRQMSWESFLADYLVGTLHAAHLVCGHDHHFGYRGEGNPQLLQAFCAAHGLGCDVIPKVELDGQTVSSTLIRGLLASGEMEQVNHFLGHPHCLTGEVVHGKGLGRQLGTPTANLLIPDGIQPPAFGVYATRVWIDGQAYPAVTNVGVRPTVEHTSRVTVEPWILDFQGDLYGQTIRVEFYKALRGEKRFSDIEALREEILRNGEQTRAYFASL